MHKKGFHRLEIKIKEKNKEKQNPPYTVENIWVQPTFLYTHAQTIHTYVHKKEFHELKVFTNK